MQSDEKLIELVRINKILYNKQCFGYKGVQEKQQVWVEIADKLGSTATECSKRWKTIRERYSREVKHLETEGKAENTVEWPLFKPLSFLRKYVKRRNPRNTKSPTDFSYVGTPLQNVKHISTEDSYFSDTCNQFYEISNEEEMALKQEMNSPEEEEFSPRDEVSSPRDDVMPPRQVITRKVVEIPKEAAVPSEVASSKHNTAIHSFGQTVAAFLSEMSEAKQAKAMRVLFDALITIKMEPEEP